MQLEKISSFWGISDLIPEVVDLGGANNVYGIVSKSLSGITSKGITPEVKTSKIECLNGKRRLGAILMLGRNATFSFSFELLSFR